MEENMPQPEVLDNEPFLENNAIGDENGLPIDQDDIRNFYNNVATQLEDPVDDQLDRFEDIMRDIPILNGYRQNSLRWTASKIRMALIRQSAQQVFQWIRNGI